MTMIGLQEDPGEFAEIILTRFLKKRTISLLQEQLCFVFELLNDLNKEFALKSVCVYYFFDLVSSLNISYSDHCNKQRQQKILLTV